MESIRRFFGLGKCKTPTHTGSDFLKLADLLSRPTLQEEFLGVAEFKMPTPDKIIADAARLQQYAKSEAYTVFAKEVWARSLGHLDKILDSKTPPDQLAFHRGALSASLDLLRLSYQAKQAKEQLESQSQTAPSRRS